jgi:hypothetical protein
MAGRKALSHSNQWTISHRLPIYEKSRSYGESISIKPIGLEIIKMKKEKENEKNN